MQPARILAIVLLALLLAGPRPTLAHPSHGVPTSGYIFAGTDYGQIYRSADGGSTWEEVAGFADEGGLHAIQSLAVAPDGAAVYAATWGLALKVSADDGTSWQAANGSGAGAIPSDARLAGVGVDPLDGRHLFTVSHAGAYYESKDGGHSWSVQQLPPAASDSFVECIALNPQRPSTLFVGASDGGLLVSTDGGGTWIQAIGVPSYAASVSVAVDPRHPDLAYLAADGALYRSADGGTSWEAQDDALLYGSGVVAVDPSGLAGVLVGSLMVNDIARSRDGATWRGASVSPRYGGAIRAFAFDPARPARMLASTDSAGLLVSTDSGGSWHSAPNPDGDMSHSVAVFATTPRIAVPSDPVDPPSDSSHTRYFPATRHSVRGPFLSFWNRHGNGPIFGSPITEPFIESGQTVQYFERARLAYSGGQVAVSPFGLTITAGRHFPPVASVSSSTVHVYFPTTGHTLADPFLAYWRLHEGSLIMGPPISEPLREQNGDGTGRTYLVQYFRNVRLEYHPELAGTPYVVAPGLLGRQVLHQRGWI